MSENLGITSSSIAKSFATAMGQLAQEEGKGYIKQIVTSAGRTYVYDRNPSGKMDAKDIVQVANKIAQDALSVSGKALTGEELKNIEMGMEKLQGRLSAHAEKLERSWFKNIFVRIDYNALAEELTRPNYREELTNKLAGVTFKQFNRNDLLKYGEKIIRDFLDPKKDMSLDEAKNKFLEEFLLEEYPEYKSLEELIGKEEFMKLVNENKDLREIMNYISNDKLTDDGQTSLQMQFNVIILEQQTKMMDHIAQTRDSSYRERFAHFRSEKSKQVFPKEVEGTDAKAAAETVSKPNDLSEVDMQTNEEVLSKSETKESENTQPTRTAEEKFAIANNRLMRMQGARRQKAS